MLEVGNLGILAGMTADEIIEAVNVVAREYGYEYRKREPARWGGGSKL